jgi:hypothetical protein
VTEERARIFISCGQQKDTGEANIAQEICNMLSEKGYEPYVAVQEQTLSGLKENIFARLSDSEYLIFIDFAREKLSSTSCRGSLFSHQELAIASYIQLDAIAFQQEGVSLEGMMKAMQLNAIPFNKPADLPKMVVQEIDKRGWQPNWKNILQLEIASPQYEDARIDFMGQQRMARFFHLTVKNRHISKIATSCTAYLKSIIKLPEKIETPLRTVELKWAGYTMPTAAIMPSSERNLDAFFIVHGEPLIRRFRCFSDSSSYGTPILGYGDYLLTYVVISENFPVASITVKITIGNNLESASIAAYP